jgi:hypothetical protein
MFTTAQRCGVIILMVQSITGSERLRLEEETAIGTSLCPGDWRGLILDKQILHGVGDKVKHRGVLGSADGAIPPFFVYSWHALVESHFSRIDSNPPLFRNCVDYPGNPSLFGGQGVNVKVGGQR